MLVNVATGKGRDPLQGRMWNSVLEIPAFIKGNEYPKHAALSTAMVMNWES